MSTLQQAHTESAEIPVSKPRYIYAFSVLYVLFVLDFAARLGVLSVFPLMREELGLTGTQLGLVGSIVLLGMSCFVLPFSFVADSTSRKKFITVMSTIWGLGCLACGLATHFVFIVCGRFLIGMGNAAYAPVSVSLLTSWTPKKRWGTVVGIYNSSMSVGIALGTSVASILAAHFGWRSAFIVFGISTLLFGFLALTLPGGGGAKTTANTPKISVREGVGTTLKNKTVLLMGLGIGLSNMALTTMMTWLPIWLTSTLKWTNAEAGSYLGILYFMAGVLMTPLGGFMSDKLGKWDERTRSWFGFPVYLLSAIFFVLGIVFESFPAIAVGYLAFFLPITGVHIATQSLVPARYKASSYGTYVTLLQGLGFLGPIVAGALSDAFGLYTALIAIQCATVIGSFCLLIGGFTYNSDRKRAAAFEAVEASAKL